MKLKKLTLSLAIISLLFGESAFLSANAQGGGATVNVQQLKKDNDLLKQEVEQLKIKMNELLKRSEQRQEEADETFDDIETQIGKIGKLADGSRPGGTKTLLSGYADAGFTDRKGENSSFSASFNPLFLWKLNDRLLFEGEVELGLEGSATDVGLEYAQTSYLLNDHLTLGVGKFLTPFGTFSERLHPTWINKLPDAPLTLQHHGGIAPMTSLGAQLRGGLAAGRSKFNYSFYVSNGPRLNVGDGGFTPTADDDHDDEAAHEDAAVDDDHDEVGGLSALSQIRLTSADHEDEGDEQSDEEIGHDAAGLGSLDFENYENFGDNKAVGGRFGYLPIPELEVAYSFQYARMDAQGTSQDQANALLQAVDLSYIRDSERLRGTLDLRTQWMWSLVDDLTYVSDGEPIFFENDQQGGYMQVAYRPSKLDHRFLKNYEGVVRWDLIDQPGGAPGEIDQERWTFGLNYWFNPNTVVKAAYQFGEREDGHGDEQSFHGVLLQAAMGF